MVKFKINMDNMIGFALKFTQVLLMVVLLSLFNIVQISVILFEKQISIIGSWDLKITFLALWTKIKKIRRIFFQILKQYLQSHVYAKGHNPSYQVIIFMPKRHFITNLARLEQKRSVLPQFLTDFKIVFSFVIRITFFKYLGGIQQNLRM